MSTPPIDESQYVTNDYFEDHSSSSQIVHQRSSSPDEVSLVEYSSPPTQNAGLGPGNDVQVEDDTEIQVKETQYNTGNTVVRYRIEETQFSHTDIEGQGYNEHHAIPDCGGSERSRGSPNQNAAPENVRENLSLSENPEYTIAVKPIPKTFQRPVADSIDILGNVGNDFKFAPGHNASKQKHSIISQTEGSLPPRKTFQGECESIR